MKTMMLIDVSGYLAASFFVSQNDKDVKTQEEKDALWKFILINMIQTARKKYNPDEVVLVLDSPNTWRKDYFKYYKARRTLKKKDDTTDWERYHKVSNEMLEEIKNHFPFKVIKVDKAEADDIIAILTEKNLEFSNKIIIVSKDKDFLQLLRYEKVVVYNPSEEKEMTVENPVEFLLLHYLKGDTGDDVPNLLSDDNVFVNSDKRQKSVSKKVIAEFLENPEKYVIDNDLVNNYERNKKLITLSCEMIPEEIQIETEYKYSNITVNNDYESVMRYFIINNMNSLL